MIDIDSWFPNFSLFVLFILPVLILVTLFVFFLAWFIEKMSKRAKSGGPKFTWMDFFKFATMLYLVVPAWRILDYIQGNLGWKDLVHGLFVTDFQNYMVLALITGIFGLVLIARSKFLKWRVAH